MKIHVGDFFLCEQPGLMSADVTYVEPFILIQSAEATFCLVSLRFGNRWENGIEVSQETALRLHSDSGLDVSGGPGKEFWNKVINQDNITSEKFTQISSEEVKHHF
jgi:hypothetical protein